MTLPFSGLLIPKATAVLVANLGFDASYLSTDAVNPTAALTITVKRDGTWTVTVGPNDDLNGGTASGTWAVNPAFDVGDLAEVQFVTANEVNSPNITNGASSYTALTSDRTIAIDRGAGASASVDVTVNVRASSLTVTDSIVPVTVDGT